VDGGKLDDSNTAPAANAMSSPSGGESSRVTDKFGTGSDDIESLERSSPDDIASEYANASSEGGDQIAVEGEPGFAGAVRGDGTRICPADYPIKGNAGSMIYYSPSRASYEATIAEWCFASEEAAENAGFRAPKR
jgi:hypothetical protein